MTFRGGLSGNILLYNQISQIYFKPYREEVFKTTTTREQNVRYPTKPSVLMLGDSFETAKARLLSLDTNIKRNKQLKI